MLDKASAGRLFDYTVWANHRVMRMAATLPIDDFRKDLGSSHGGVRGTLVHMFSAEWILIVFIDSPFRGSGQEGWPASRAAARRT